jgi:methyl acetate hydrolase
MLTPQPAPRGRSVGSLTWAGIFNTYYWLDPQKRIAGVFLTQILSFADPNAVTLYGEFESGIYGGRTDGGVTHRHWRLVI